MQDGRTALMLAAIGGRSEMVKLLLHRHKATVDEKDPVRWYKYKFIILTKSNAYVLKAGKQERGEIKSSKEKTIMLKT